MVSYYETLGVRKNAAKKTIKTAYRKLAQKNHPDKGGDAGDFAELNHIYNILMNKEKRKRYDETGDTGKINGVTPEAKLAELFNVVISEHKIKGDIKENCKKMARHAIIEAEQVVAQQEKRLFTLEKLIGRIVTNREINLFEGILREKMDANKKTSDMNKEQVKLLKKVLLLLGEYDDTNPDKETQRTGFAVSGYVTVGG